MTNDKTRSCGLKSTILKLSKKVQVDSFKKNDARTKCVTYRWDD